MRIPHRLRGSAKLVIVCCALSVLTGTGYAAVRLPGEASAGERTDAVRLPGGRTLRGVYFVGSSSATGNQLATGHISFALALQGAPIGHFMTLGTRPSAVCPGSAGNPRAARGHLCVYEARQSQAVEQRLVDPVSGETRGRVRPWGAGIALRAVRGGDAFSSGTWAVTGV